MIKSKNSRKRWLPIVLVPMFSLAVLAGCSSDDDDESSNGMTDAGEGEVPAAFLATGTTGDSDADGVLDIYQTGADGSLTDTNGNMVDDSYEVALSGGTDADGDGIDDDAAAALVTDSTDPDATDPDATDPDATDPDATDPDATDPDATDPDAGGEVVDQTGPINNNQLPIGTAGVAALTWDGFNLNGQIEIADGVQAVGAAVYTGVAAAGNGQQAVVFNGNAPTYFFPTGVAADQQALIAENIVAGNLYIQVDLADGTSQNGIILLNGVEPKFTALSGDNAVPAQEVFSNGAGFINVNTVTGDFTAVVNVNLNGSDEDADGAPETVSAVHIHSGAVGEDGPVVVGLADTGDGRTWGVKATLSAADLATVLSGDAYFNAHRTDSTNFIRGQIPGSN